MAFSLVTPASRGIGLALTRQILSTTSSSLPVIGTARHDLDGVREQILSNLPSETKASERLDLVACDLESESSVADMAGYVRERYMDGDGAKDGTAHLRLAFCVPGMLVPERSPEKIEYDSALQSLKLNLLAPMMLAKYLTPFLPRKSAHLERIEGVNDAAVMAFMSARVGSISDNGRGGWYSYRSSKAGVNQLAKSLDIHLKMRSGEKAMSVALHPGTVKTGLSKEFWESTPKDKLFEAGFAAERLVEVVRGVDEGKRGRCWDWKGEEVMP